MALDLLSTAIDSQKWHKLYLFYTVVTGFALLHNEDRSRKVKFGCMH